VVHTHLETDPVVVAAAGRNTAGTSGAWSEWGVQASTGFTDAASAVCNSHLSLAVSEHSSTWNPVAQRVATRVSALGSNVSEAGVTVDESDVDMATLLSNQTSVAAEHGSVFNRPVNTGEVV
jgi:hypothetical protein